MIMLIGMGSISAESREIENGGKACHAIVSYFIIQYIVAEKLRGLCSAKPVLKWGEIWPVFIGRARRALYYRP